MITATLSFDLEATVPAWRDASRIYQALPRIGEHVIIAGVDWVVDNITWEDGGELIQYPTLHLKDGNR